MRKVIKFEGECCANCAAKIQAEIEKLDGVESASVNFLTQKFTLKADDDKFSDIVAQSARIFAKIEPDCELLL